MRFSIAMLLVLALMGAVHCSPVPDTSQQASMQTAKKTVNQIGDNNRHLSLLDLGIIQAALGLGAGKLGEIGAPISALSHGAQSGTGKIGGV